MELMNATKIKSLALGLLVALSGLSACISYDNQDQYCDVGTDPGKLDDACPYGPPGGAKFAERAACPPVTPLDPSECSQANSWSANVWPAIGGTCAGGAGNGCHDDSAKGIKLTAADAKGAYDTLTKYTGASNRPYISNLTPDQAWILCNITKGQLDGGLTMPPVAGLSGTTLETVTNWAKCGQNP